MSTRNQGPSDGRQIGLLVLAVGMLVLVGGMVGTGIAIVRSDSPISEEKQQLLDKVVNPPTPDLSVGVTAAPGLPSPAETPMRRPDGLHDNAQAPWPAMLYSFENLWQTHLNGNLVIVYAGHLGYGTRDDGRGVVVIDSRPGEPMSSFVAPAGTGSLHIADVQGEILAIQASTGETYYLDVVSRDFTDEEGNPVPTDSPSPTPFPNGPPSPGGTLPFELPFPTDTATPTPVPGTASAVPAPTAIAD